MAIKIVWNKRPITSLNKALKYISKDSYLQAEKVENRILDAIDDLIINPERHPLDQYKINNDGSFRAFEQDNYRISYRTTSKQIRILRIRHVKKKHLNYK